MKNTVNATGGQVKRITNIMVDSIPSKLLTKDFTQTLVSGKLKSNLRKFWIDTLAAQEGFEGIHYDPNDFEIKEYMITPIYDLEEGLKKGNYDNDEDHDFTREHCKEIAQVDEIIYDRGMEVALVRILNVRKFTGNDDCIRSKEKLISILNLIGYRPGNAAELFGLDAKYPKLSKEYGIAAWGSIYDTGVWKHEGKKDSYFASYWTREAGKILNLMGCHQGSGKSTQFLAVSKFL